MADRLKIGSTEHLFRPVYEASKALLWMGAGLITPGMAIAQNGSLLMGPSLAVSGGLLAMSGYYANQAYPLVKRQMSLTVNHKEFISIQELRKMNQVKERFTGTLKKDTKKLFLSNGFEWGSEHAERAYQVMDMDSVLSEVQLNPILKLWVNSKLEETRELGGFPWIHGMGDSKKVFTAVDNWFGHTLLTGNIGTGKTVTLKQLSLNAIHMGNIVIIIDPKRDEEWLKAVKAEYQYLGKGDQFYEFCPATPSQSCRIPLLKHYTRITEISDRVAPLMGDGSTNNFEDFAHSATYHSAIALDYLGEPIRLTKLQKIIATDRKGLAMRVFNKYMTETLGEDWAEKYGETLEQISNDRLLACANYYISVLQHEHESKVVESMIEFALHEDAHYTKMVTSFRPVLTTLTAHPLDELLSPIDDVESTDTRPYLDIHNLVEKGGCLYISLDSMNDSRSAGFMARLIQAEIATVAGQRYNNGDIENARRVSIFNDEAHAAVENNDAILNLLAQGRAAKMEMFLSTQTISDIRAKTDVDTANRILGLCNNFISLRTTDPETKKYVAEQFSKASISQIQVQKGTSSSTSGSIFSFDGNSGERFSRTREEAFPGDLLGQLPKLQSVARLADGRRLKLKQPIILCNENEGVAEWLSAA